MLNLIPAPREAVIVSWENLYQPIPQLLKAGFRIINASWRPLYVVTHKGYYWSPEKVYNWIIYTWRCLHPDSPYHGKTLLMEPTEQVEGGQLLAWGIGTPPRTTTLPRVSEPNSASWRSACPACPRTSEIGKSPPIGWSSADAWRGFAHCTRRSEIINKIENLKSPI